MENFLYKINFLDLRLKFNLKFIKTQNFSNKNTIKSLKLKRNMMLFNRNLIIHVSKFQHNFIQNT